MLTVTTASATHDLTVLATVKEELGITGTASDALLARLIAEASADAERYCDRVFARETVEETFRLASPREVLLLSRYPAIEIASVTVDDAALEAAEWEADDPSGLLYRLSDATRISWAAGTVVVAYEAGYELLATLPREIERAVIIIVRDLWFEKARDAAIRSQEIPDVETISYLDPDKRPRRGGLPADAADRLDAYRSFRL
jgi:hypothetical protein